MVHDIRFARPVKIVVEVEKERTKRRISFGLKQLGGTNVGDSSAVLNKCPEGAFVLMNRQVIQRWEGLHKLVRISGETVMVQTTTGRAMFRSTCVTP